MPLMSEVKQTGKRGERIGTFLSWMLAVLACLWVAWCCAIGPLYWFGDGLSDFGWLNVLYLVVAFAIWFSIVVALVRFGRGVAYFRNISHDGMKNYATRLQERRPPCLALCCDTCMMPRTAAQGAPACSDRMDGAQTHPLHRLLVETHAGVRNRLAVDSNHAIGRVRRDIRSQIREFSWALNQWTGLKQPYIGFFSFVPMDIYPTAHYMWPDNPTYLTDQHNVVLTVFYGAAAAVSRYFTDSNDAGIVVLAALQWLFAAFCCSATANRFFNLPWRRLGVGTFDFSHPERHDCWNMRDYAHPEAGVVARPSRLRAGAKTRFMILLFFMVCPLAVFATISLTKSPLFAFAFVWWFGVWYELHMTHIKALPTINGKPTYLRKRSIMAFTISSCVMLISAKYAWYIILFTLILALINDRKRWKTYLVALLLPTILIHGGIVFLTNTGASSAATPSKAWHPTAADRARRQIQSERHSGGRGEKA